MSTGQQEPRRTGGLCDVIRPRPARHRAGMGNSSLMPHDFIVEMRHGNGPYKQVARGGRSLVEAAFHEHVWDMKALPITGVRMVDHEGNVVTEETPGSIVEKAAELKAAKERRKKAKR